MGLNLKKLASNIRDVFDANTASDQAKRVAAGQAQMYQQQQAQKGVNARSIASNPVQRAVVMGTSIARPVVKGVQTAVPTVGKGARGAYDLVDLAQESVRGTDQSYQAKLRESLARINNTAGYSKSGGFLGAGTSLQSVNDLNDPKKFVGSMVETGANLAQIVPTGAAVKKGTELSAKQLIKPVANYANASGLMNVASEGGRQLSEEGKVNGQSLATAYASGAALPVAGAVGSKVVPKVLKAADKSLQAPLSDAQLQARNKAVVGWNEAVAQGKTAAAEMYDRQIKEIDNRGSNQGGYIKVSKTPKANVVKSKNTVENIATELQDAQAKREARIMEYSGAEKVRAKGRNVSEQIFNPYAEAERFNAKLAQSMGISPKDLSASRDLAHNLDVVSNSGVAAGNIAEKSGLQEVIGRYKPGSQDEANFITYMAMKRDLDVRGKKGIKILPYEVKDLQKAVSDFEARNPQATQDMGTINAHFRIILENARKAGTVTEAAYQKALATEDFYAPIARVLGSEDVLRPTINANVKGALSKQTALQTLTGSDKPINTTWDAVVGATTKTTKENARNKTFNIMYDAADKGFVDDMVRMGMTKEQSKSLLDLRGTIDELQKLSQGAGKQVKLASKAAKVDSKKATAVNNKLQNAAIKKIAAAMDAVDPDGAAALRNLPRKDQAQLTEWLRNGMTEAQIQRGNKVNAKAQESYGRLMALRAEAEGLLDQSKLARSEASDLTIVKNDKTGRQVISGFVDGYPVWLETTPEMAKMLQGLEPQQLDVVSRNLAGVQHVWRTFWTGIFNPVFAAKSKIFYDIPMLMLNQSGSRNQLRPTVMAGALGDNFTDVGKFFDELKQYGVAPVTGSRIMGDVKQTADIMASHADFQSRVGYLAKHPSAALQAMDVFGGKAAHGSRMSAARAEFQKSMAAKLPREEALQNAARAYNNILPNYARTSKLIRTLDAWIPYAGAGIAGTRSMTSAMRKDPVGWGVKASAFATALSAVGVYAMGDEKTQEFYQDMYDSNKQSIIQNNIVFALPGASKDPETGEWTGIVKIPIPPEFRAPNALIQDTAFKSRGGEANGYDPRLAAVSTIASGGIANIGREGTVNVEMNPGLNAAIELTTNKRGGTGDSFAYGDTQFLERNAQANKDTSQAAISAAQAFNKLPIGDISPAALDAQFKSFGSTGKAIRSVASGALANENTTADQLPGTDWKKSITGVVDASGTKGMTDTKWHFRNQDQIRESLTTKDLRDSFDKLNSKNDTPGDSQAKSQLLYESLQSDGKLWAAQKQQNDLDAKKSGISNPLFDLTPEQARAVTLYRGNARLNAAKQSYAKDGSSLFESLGLDEAWYQDFKKKEGEFYDKIAAKKGDKETDSNVATAAKTYSGQAYTPTSPVMQSKLDKYYSLPSKSAERKAYLKANPDIVAYWSQQNGFANEERLAMGLDLLEADKYGGQGYGSGGAGSKKASNPYDMAVSLNAGGDTTPPKVKASKVAKRGVSSKTKATKPKVSIKKSLV